nr:hypothetical protein [Desulfobacterales bacterium]
YPDFAAYAASKARIFKNQQKNDTAILNNNDSLVKDVTEKINSKKIYFSTQAAADSELADINFSNEYFAASHNKENAYAAALAALAGGGNLHGIQTAINNF